MRIDLSDDVHVGLYKKKTEINSLWATLMLRVYDGGCL